MTTQLFTDITAADTVVCVNHAELFPADEDTYIRISREVIKVTARVGTGIAQITMERGMFGTTPVAHSKFEPVMILDPIAGLVAE